MWTRTLPVLLIIFAAWSDSSVTRAADGTEAAILSRTVLRNHCYRCHNSADSEGGFDILNRAALDEKSRVVPGKGAESNIIAQMKAGRMPPATIPVRPSPDEIALVEKWIGQGAIPVPEVTIQVRPQITLVQLLTTIRDHLRNAPRDQRQYLRYFTLHNLYNHPGIQNNDLIMYRFALSKALNSLSWKNRIVEPKALDPAQTLYVVDLRDLDWDRGEQWNEIMSAYPYGLKYGNHPDPELQRLDDDIDEEAHCSLPLIRADWFVAIATKPPLYHSLLGLPKYAGELEKKLEVNIAANFNDPKPERISRAAYPKSGISGQNRMVERNEAKYGSYWKSYDFKPESARAKLTRYPLGPLNLFPVGKHPYSRQAFVHDGGEIVFNLPNGLQGYFLINGKDERIDEGPIAVVSDSLKTSGTPAIVTGLSCIACHAQGMKPFQDTIRLGNGVFGDAERKVLSLYPEIPVMDKLLAEDTDRFMSALLKTAGPFLPPGTDLKIYPEPVGEVARWYRLVYLDLETVAHELDIADPRSIIEKVGEKKLKQLGLENLTKKGGVIPRTEWEAKEGVSLMQELARELRYTPYNTVK